MTTVCHGGFQTATSYPQSPTAPTTSTGSMTSSICAQVLLIAYMHHSTSKPSCNADRGWPDGLLHPADHRLFSGCRSVSHAAALPAKLVSKTWKTDCKVCWAY